MLYYCTEWMKSKQFITSPVKQFLQRSYPFSRHKNRVMNHKDSLTIIKAISVITSENIFHLLIHLIEKTKDICLITHFIGSS